MAVKDNRQNKIGKKISIKTITDYTYALEKAFKNNGMRVVIAEIEFLDDGIKYSMEVAEGIKADKILSLEKEIAFCLSSPTGNIKIESPTPNIKFFNITVPYRKEELPIILSKYRRTFLSNILLNLSTSFYKLGIKLCRKA